MRSLLFVAVVATACSAMASFGEYPETVVEDHDTPSTEEDNDTYYDSDRFWDTSDDHFPDENDTGVFTVPQDTYQMLTYWAQSGTIQQLRAAGALLIIVRYKGSVHLFAAMMMKLAVLAALVGCVGSLHIEEPLPSETPALYIKTSGRVNISRDILEHTNCEHDNDLHILRKPHISHYMWKETEKHELQDTAQKT